MEQLHYLEEQLGLMAWPLIICSALTAMIIIERLFQIAISSGVGKSAIRQELNQASPVNEKEIEALAKDLVQKRPLLYKGVAMLLAHHSFAKSLREDAASIWLQDKRHQLHSGLRILGLIGVISPLIGLLGTVLGLIEMFKGIAAASGNVTPNDLADGLGLAMRTTAAGLIIALPAIAGSQLIGLWADRIVAKLEHTLNYVNLWLEGVEMQHSDKDPLVVDNIDKLPARAAHD
ncbi:MULTISPECIES: MotA/TolQ/ExbB proton channel family protein [Vibrio]|jgi:biopolymer transport protein ExbB|uniref:MotA/TolQ/ExbB proton channel family protein n=1 Tax=Vibrio mediterranei TaxID=689 RepID=A0ABX5DIL6_9VIBR|nr:MULTISPECIES: MotA/TolQ/ExbB proton channel family protein [Vibrio]KFA98160.1 biopolymer transporter ExbB [Vibrio sp. ER1A]MCF4174963.1 MotA/TolQ/ExbB proton channel family protein [Vibrio sp. McD22-P3]MCG9659776.1 MotA/TolQ/ExbB proton channel family protein [Vibrio mediterranei]MCG9663030.1 MotA/TolQ/ExbB proton channel family protein [Vibrio mediterranei]NOI22292.1 MotA/TolQ/ExbB proton channel family protein [Vibrio mediterranei]